MPLYSYKATTREGRISEGKLEAESERKVIEHLQKLGQIPIKISSKGMAGGGLLARDLRLPAFFHRVSKKELLLFTQEFQTLFAAGLPLDRCLQVLIDVTENAKLREISRSILSQVQGGSALADALASHPRVFPKLYVNMVRAGEAGGVLAPIFQRLSEYLERTQELKDSVVSAMIYPAILVTFGAASIIFMITFVIPKFSAMFADLGQGLPASTAAIMFVSVLLRQYWWIIVLFILACVVFLWYYSKTDDGRLFVDKAKLKIFIVGDLVRKIETARFSRTLGTLIKSGVPILSAMNIVREILSNRIMANALREVSSGIKGGKGISQPLKTSGVFPSLALHLIEVGEETGQLDSMLLKIADTYDREISYAVKRFISLLEPVMILTMGLIIGFVVVSMLMAIFSVNDLAM